MCIADDQRMTPEHKNDGNSVEMLPKCVSTENGYSEQTDDRSIDRSTTLLVRANVYGV